MPNFKINLFSVLLILLSTKVIAQTKVNVDLLNAVAQELLTEEDKANGTTRESGFWSKQKPHGEMKSPVPPDCHPHSFREKILNDLKSPRQFAQQAKAYFNRCSKYLTSGNILGLPGLVKFANIEYNLAENKLIRQQTLSLSDGTKIEAYIGVKDPHTRRPWVIAKCGVFCDISSSSSSLNFIINFFDQSPFNLIFISNHTGEKHIKSNQMLTLGGYYEVHDYYDIAYWLKYQSPYQKTVDSIHAAGISLGGSAALAVSHWSHLYPTPDNQPLFNSTTAICPVVNLGPTLKDMYGESLKGRVFTKLTWDHLQAVSPSLPEAQDYLGKKKAPPSVEFPKILSDITLRYGREWELSRPPGRVAPLPESPEEVVALNNYVGLGSQQTIPTFVWASHDDHIVNYKLNTRTLVERATSSDSLGALDVEYGDHCGFTSAYGFAATTIVLQSFILGHSPEFLSQRKPMQLAYSLPAPALAQGEMHLRQWWKADSSTETVTLSYETFDRSRGLRCRFSDPFRSPLMCRKTYSQKVPLSQLKALGVQKPTNVTEAEILSRQLNVMVRIGTGVKPIDGTGQLPNALLWETYSAF